MNGDSDRSAKHRVPPTKARKPCAICGSSDHTVGYHESAGPDGQPSGPIRFATEEVVVEDDDYR
jgi:hypothetical protein